MKAKLVENINFERGKEPKKAMNVGLSSMTSKELAEKALTDLYFEYVQYVNYDGFGQWLAILMKELFISPTYGDYPIEKAQEDFYEFLHGWNRIMEQKKLET